MNPSREELLFGLALTKPAAGADNTVRLWDASSGKLLRTYFGHTSVINAVAFSRTAASSLPAARTK